MFDIGWTEMLVIASVAIIVVGPKDLPRMLRTIGKTVGNVRRMAGSFQNQFNDALKEAEVADLKNDLAKATKVPNPLDDINKSADEMMGELNIGTKIDDDEALLFDEDEIEVEAIAKPAETTVAEKITEKKPAEKPVAKKATPAKKRAPAKKPAASAKAKAPATKAKPAKAAAKPTAARNIAAKSEAKPAPDKKAAAKPVKPRARARKPAGSKAS